MNRGLPIPIVCIVLAVSCGDKPHRDLEWRIAPAAIDRALWAKVCGSRESVSGDDWSAPYGRAIESWSGKGRSSCWIQWEWGGQPVVRDAYGVVVVAYKEEEIRRLVDLILKPMLPPEVHVHLESVIQREFTVFSIEAPGFNFAGGYNEGRKSWDVRVKRQRDPIGKRAIGW